jgi:hypothetical protein
MYTSKGRGTDTGGSNRKPAEDRVHDTTAINAAKQTDEPPWTECIACGQAPESHMPVAPRYG